MLAYQPAAHNSGKLPGRDPVHHLFLPMYSTTSITLHYKSQCKLHCPMPLNGPRSTKQCEEGPQQKCTILPSMLPALQKKKPQAWSQLWASEPQLLLFIVIEAESMCKEPRLLLITAVAHHSC
mmetsp:Transcript_28182/g.72493  ORF Transcript_28182/g.72493 Transcript_28182/m.72493 type:complete len:123 (-) Transcript_28182:749-1117(-)